MENLIKRLEESSDSSSVKEYKKAFEYAVDKKVTLAQCEKEISSNEHHLRIHLDSLIKQSKDAIETKVWAVTSKELKKMQDVLDSVSRARGYLEGMKNQRGRLEKK